MTRLSTTITISSLALLATLSLISLFSNNLRTLFGMSADCLSGEATDVARRPPRTPARDPRKTMRDFSAEVADAPPGPATRSFEALVPNTMTPTARDALSTFAIDVDTASYSYARRMLLTRHRRPEPASVRVEEWVNAFSYGLRPPRSAPFAVTVDGATSPFDETKTLLRVALKGREVAAADRKPADLVFLVDVSGSMDRPDRLPLARQALKVLTSQLKASDTVALVTYAGSTEVVLEPTSAAKQAVILSAIDRLRAGGGTAMGSGMELAYGLAVRSVRPGRTSRVLVLTDGDANIGRNQTADQMLAAVRHHVEEGVTLTTVGFGMGNYRAAALEALADKGNGQALYIDGEQEIRRVFVDQLTGTLEVIAKDVKVQVAFDPQVVTSYRLVGYENRALADEDFRNDRVDAGELGAGHSVTALYEVTLSSASGALGTVSVRGKLPDGDQVFEVTEAMPRQAVSRQLAEGSSDLRFAAAVALAADHLRGNIAEAWSLAAIARLAEGAVDERADREEFVRMLRAAEGGSTRFAHVDDAAAY
jgi:Ca-activated chloride channel family protein